MRDLFRSVPFRSLAARRRNTCMPSKPLDSTHLEFNYLFIITVFLILVQEFSAFKVCFSAPFSSPSQYRRVSCDEDVLFEIVTNIVARHKQESDTGDLPSSEPERHREENESIDVGSAALAYPRVSPFPGLENGRSGRA